jgi:hypothetical protein
MLNSIGLAAAAAPAVSRRRRLRVARSVMVGSPVVGLGRAWNE